MFDLDGTLVDSVLDLTDALNRLMAARALPPFDATAVQAMVGDGAAALVRRGFEARDHPPDHAALSTFLADYTANATRKTREYPLVTPTLARLRRGGWTLAVCTNKPGRAAAQVLQSLRLDHFFSAVCGGDSVPRGKPDPIHLLSTLRLAGASKAHAIMVGDHHNDVLAANAAGIPCIFAAWGYGSAAMASGAAANAAAFDEIPKLADRLLAGP